MFAASVRIDNSAQAAIWAENVRNERSDRRAIALNFGQILGKHGDFCVREQVCGVDTDFDRSAPAQPIRLGYRSATLNAKLLALSVSGRA